MAAYDVCGFTEWAVNHGDFLSVALRGVFVGNTKPAPPKQAEKVFDEGFANLAIDIYATVFNSDAWSAS